jgi:hypothetical protein
MRISLALAIAIGSAAPSVAAETAVDYARDVKPILKQRCYACHGALKQKSGLRLDTAALVLRGGDGGPVVVPRSVPESLLVEKIEARDEKERMPPEGMPLTPEQIALIRAWIEQGAAAPAKEEPEPDPREHWAFRKPVRIALLSSGSPKPTAENPIDSFVLARLQEAGLRARPLAEKPLLLRRVFLDLIGLPPTREELQAFIADDSPDAWTKVVDCLLGDPRYGERWGRHWMDVWRYSDWYGRRHVPDVWNSAPQIWRWRDWIVRSLNADHGYDRMLREMLAADEVCPEDDAAAVATGYLIRNWYALNPNDWMRSTVEHTGKAFLGLTFNCAHCHDHKYDPITQEDYFRLRAFFEPIGVRQDRVPGEVDPGPFQEYSYSVLRIIQRLGAVRIFDKTPDAPTWFYTGGDERNRVKERGSIAPGVPAFLAEPPPRIAPVELPAPASHPGLRPAIQEMLLSEARSAIVQADAETAAARSAGSEVPQELRDRLAQTEAAYSAALLDAEKSGQQGALAGRQSLLIDASSGRRILQNALTQLKSLEDGTTLEFQLLILSDAHFNFQLARDLMKGHTAGCVVFEKGRILSYQPGSFTEFEAGRYDFAAGQKQFLVRMVLQTKADRCLLTVRSVRDDILVVDGAAVALNGWNPAGNPGQGVFFDARPGSVAAIDAVVFSAPPAAEAGGNALPARLAAFEFEPPVYTDGRDVTGIEGWGIHSLSVAPANSVASSNAANASLREHLQKLQLARRAARAPTLRLRAAEARSAAARAALTSVEGRIAADRVKVGSPAGAEVAALSVAAGRGEREAAVAAAQADLLAQERVLVEAEAKPAADANRGKEIDAAAARMAAAQAALEKAQQAPADESQAGKYTPCGPEYPRTSTGRRRALAEWITGRDHPLTARVAVNHIWSRHFHAPLVASVYDFGRNGASPTHPELLDWLAVELMESGWSMKHLHRLIVTSDAYRRVSSAGSASDNLAKDPENRLLWRMNVGRMESEVVRDSLLYCAGRLDLRSGGQELENGEALTTYRRSLYYSVFPEQGGKSSLGELFDAPDALECYRRTRSIVPQQALALTNSDLVHQMSAAVVADWENRRKTSGAPPDGDDRETQEFVGAMFEQILSRVPTERERQICQETFENQRGLAARTNTAEAGTRARESLVRALFNHNDFITIR